MPTPDSHCPGEFIGVPCLTLQQYASNPSQLSQNITFLVEPGTYNLSTVLTVSNGYNFTMSSTNATVVCTSPTAQFTFDTVENVHISGMTFRGCTNTAVRMLTITRAEIISSNFIDNQCQCNGGGIYVSSSSITITDSEFLSNQAYFYSGGSIFARSSALVIKRSIFIQNGAHYSGGAIFVASFNLTITMSSFNNNYVNISTSYPRGGAICVYGGSFQMNDTLLIGNAGRYDGAVYAYISYTVSVKHCHFFNNYAESNGEAMHLRNYNVGGIMDCQFSSNSAGGNGGALYAYTYDYTLEGNLSITYCDFIGNTAGENGGALYNNMITRNYRNYNNVNSSTTHSHFSGNTASVSGGAIYNSGSYTEVTNTYCSNNRANSFGGGLHIAGTNS